MTARREASCLVVADASAAREQLVTDLVVLGFGRSSNPDAVHRPPNRDPAWRLILSDDVRNQADPRSEALRRSETGRSPHCSGSSRSRTWDTSGATSTCWTSSSRCLIHRGRRSPRAHASPSAGEHDDVVRRGPLALNPLSYQVRLDGRALDLTFLGTSSSSADGVSGACLHARGDPLPRMGVRLFGGMRTVDVHVRRVRAKLGQDHAWLIETVRGVGYRLAEVRA